MSYTIKRITAWLTLPALAMMPLTLGGCGDDAEDAAEETGEAIENAAEETGDAIEEATD